jgi:DeoR family transcriptional regulator of aga operon
MNRYERLNALLDLLAAKGSLGVETAAAELDVSAATIRRDLDHLASQQMLTRTRGGAVAHSVSYDLPLRYKSARQASQKQRIGTAAAALVGRGMVAGFTGGTTTTEVARALVTRADLQQQDGETAVTVVTNALNIANELTVRRNVKIVLTGGVARPQSYELIGPLAERVLSEVHIDITFLGVEGIDATEGAFATHEGEASVNRLLASRATTVAVVADSSKLGRLTFAHIWPTAAVDVLVTDSDGDPQALRGFEEAGVKIIAV